MIDIPQLVRRDRVALFEQRDLARGPIPLAVATYGDLSLKTNGDIAYSKASSYDSEWQTAVADVSDVHTIGWREAMNCYKGMPPSRVLHAKFLDTRYLVGFTGIVQSTWVAEKAISDISRGRFGAPAVKPKSAFHIRSNKGRAMACRDLWLRVLTGELSASDLTPITEH